MMIDEHELAPVRDIAAAPSQREALYRLLEKHGCTVERQTGWIAAPPSAPVVPIRGGDA